MIAPASSYNQLETRFAAWAAADARVRALLVVGSRAHPTDAAPLSDLDLIAVVTQPREISSGLSWLREISEVWLVFHSHTGLGDSELVVLFNNAMKVDIVFEQIAPDTSAGDTPPAFAAASKYQFVIAQGWRALYPQSDPATGDTLTTAAAVLPDETTFLNDVNHAFLIATQVVKFLLRGDQWRARQLCECDMRRLLFRMAGWHSLVTNLSGPAPGLEGRHIETWAADEVQEKLAVSVAGVVPEEVARATLHSLSLFRELAQVVAAELGTPYPHAMDERVTNWIGTMMPGAQGIF